MKDRHDATLSKHRYLCNFGNLVIMMEHEFQQPFSQAKKYVSKVTRNKLLDKIRLGAYFNMHVHEHLKVKFAEIPPGFKKY